MLLVSVVLAMSALDDSDMNRLYALTFDVQSPWLVHGSTSSKLTLYVVNASTSWLMS
jgi:hypothetical protein